jgi:signal transduction histidine kinase
MMVHDLRNPLASTLTAVEFMLQEAADTRPSGNILEALRIAHAQALKMQTLVNRILEILQLERRQMPVNCTSVALGELVTEMLRLQSPLAEARSIRLESDLSPALPLAWADAELIGRVLQNLIGNAIKFTPKGGWVRVKLQRQGDDQSKFLVSVCDTGPGVPAEIQNRLFQKFVRGRQEGRGTGLGLAFCKLVLEAHGERIWVDSTSAQGTTITFSLSPAPGP